MHVKNSFYWEGLATMLSSYFCFVLSIIIGSIAFNIDEPSLVQVDPSKEAVPPGWNVTFLCNTSLNVREFEWKINGYDANSADVEIVNKHLMRLHLHNVTTERYPQSTNIVCTSGEGTQQDGSTMYIGYPPPRPKMECLMRNLDDLRCRWSAPTERIGIDLNAATETDDNMSYIDLNLYDRVYCHVIVGSKSCVCSSDFDGWLHKSHLNLTLNITNQIGMSSTTMPFHPHSNVMLSPPFLLLRNMTNASERGAGLIIEAEMRMSSIKSLRDHCNFSLEIRYENIPGYVDLRELEARTKEYNTRIEENYWDAWSHFYEGDVEPFHYSWSRGADLNNMTWQINHGYKMQISSLAANVPLLLKARWKLISNRRHDNLLFECGGEWSLASYFVSRTSVIPPPHIKNIAILNFDDDTSLMSVNCDTNKNEDKEALLLWQDQPQIEFYQKNNIFTCQVRFEHCGLNQQYLVAKHLKYLPMKLNSTLENCRIKVESSNELQSFTSPWISFFSSNCGCRVNIFSISVDSEYKDVLRFNITWYFGSNTKDCDEDSIQDSLRATLFHWQEKCNSCDGISVTRTKIGSHPPNLNARLKTLYAEVINEESKDGMEGLTVEFHTSQERNNISKFHLAVDHHTAHRFAFALSVGVEDNLIQGPAVMLESLFYYNVQKPTGSPCNVDCTDVKDTSMKLTWTNMVASQRNGAITGYRIYYTSNRECFVSGHRSVSCGVLYKNCPESEIVSVTALLDDKNELGEFIAGSWYEERHPSKAMHHILDGLEPDTTYYIGVTAFNDAGVSNCIHHVFQRTQNQDVITGVTVAVVFIVFILSAYLSRKLWKHCSLDTTPRPTIQTETLQMDEERLMPNLSSHRDANKERFETVDTMLIRLDDYSLQIKQMNNNTTANGSLLHDLSHNYTNASDDAEHIHQKIGSYLRNAYPHRNMCNGDSGCRQGKPEPPDVDVPHSSSMTSNDISSESHDESNCIEDDDDIVVYIPPQEMLQLCHRMQHTLLQVTK